EPDRAGGHVRAARSADGSLSHARASRLSRREVRSGDRALEPRRGDRRSGGEHQRRKARAGRHLRRAEGHRADLDLSKTMDAIDVAPTRLERVKLKIRDLLELRKGARSATFAYAGSAHLVLPLADDAALAETFVDSLSTAIMPVPGKDTAAALKTVVAGLAR